MSRDSDTAVPILKDPNLAEDQFEVRAALWMVRLSQARPGDGEVGRARRRATREPGRV